MCFRLVLVPPSFVSSTVVVVVPIKILLIEQKELLRSRFERVFSGSKAHADVHVAIRCLSHLALQVV